MNWVGGRGPEAGLRKERLSQRAKVKPIAHLQVPSGI